MLHDGIMVQGSVETEVKIRISSKPALLERIHQAGFRVVKPRVFEANVLYDRRDGLPLSAAGMLLRLRQAGDQYVLTWKGPAQPGPHKSRPELETIVGAAQPMEQILDYIGFAKIFRYEKYRTEFESEADPGGTVTFDETPIGDYAEIEGPAGWIDRIASQLGFSDKDYILASYGSLYQAWCVEHAVAPAHMVFPS